MAKGLYRLRNIVAVPLHYGLTAVIAAGAYSMGAPWAIGVASVATLGVMTPLLWLNKEVMENHMEAHPHVHPYSPNLGKIVENLYKASGLKAEKLVVYSFMPTKNKSNSYSEIDEISFVKLGKGLRKGKSPLERQGPESSDGEFKRNIIEQFKDALRSRADILNAAAIRLGKPIIMISEPMLRLLDDEEEKAVLAHEFAHAAAHHVVLSLPVKILNAVSNVSSKLTQLGAVFAVGVWAALATFAGLIVATGGIVKLQGDQLASKDKDTLSIPEIYVKKQREKTRVILTTPLYVGAFALQNPAFLGIWLTTKAVGISSKLVAGSLSRSKEYQADHGATLLGANPLALITSLRKISTLYNESVAKAWGNTPVPQPRLLTKLWKQSTATHPTLENRMARLSDIARKNGFSESDIAHACTGKLNIDRREEVPIEIIRQAMSHFVEKLDSVKDIRHFTLT